MQNLSFLKRTYYYYLGMMLGLIYWTDSQKFVGLRVSSLIRLFSLLLPVGFWIAGWERIFLILGSIFFLWVQFSYWRAHRTGYYRFVVENSDLMAVRDLSPLPKKKHIPVFASGVFSLKAWEKNVVLRPAEYWQVPLGDHAVMVEHEPGRYLYQFFSAKTMQELKSGWLLHGSRPMAAIAVTFLSSWGPEFNEDTVSLLRKSNNNQPSKIRTIYLSFNNDEQEKEVWHNLVADARRMRSEPSA